MNRFQPVFRVVLTKQRSDLGQWLHLLKMLVFHIEVGDAWFFLLHWRVGLRLDMSYWVVEMPLTPWSDLVVAVELACHESWIFRFALDQHFIFKLIEWRKLTREEVLLGHVEKLSRKVLFEHCRDHVTLLSRAVHF